MNGFIQESVSKIADGFGSAIKLLLFVFLVTLAVIPVNELFGTYGLAAFLLLLFFTAVFYIQRSHNHQLEDSQKAWCGMAAGVLFWQVTRYFPEIFDLQFKIGLEILYWAGLAIVTFLLWRKYLNTGFRFFLLTILLNWIGWIYMESLKISGEWPRMLSDLFSILHYAGIFGMLFCIWWIVVRSHNALERKYAGMALYFNILLTFLIF